MICPICLQDIGLHHQCRDEVLRSMQERIAALEEALRDVLDKVGPCDGDINPNYCYHHGDLPKRLPCPFAEARKILEEK